MSISQISNTDSEMEIIKEMTIISKTTYSALKQHNSGKLCKRENLLYKMKRIYSCKFVIFIYLIKKIILITIKQKNIR